MISNNSAKILLIESLKNMQDTIEVCMKEFEKAQTMDDIIGIADSSLMSALENMKIVYSIIPSEGFRMEEVVPAVSSGPTLALTEGLKILTLSEEDFELFKARAVDFLRNHFKNSYEYITKVIKTVEEGLNEEPHKHDCDNCNLQGLCPIEEEMRILNGRKNNACEKYH